MRRLRNFWLGRRGSTAPGPGCGVLLKKLRSRWLVFEPTILESRARCRRRAPAGRRSSTDPCARWADRASARSCPASRPGPPRRSGSVERQRRIRRIRGERRHGRHRRVVGQERERVHLVRVVVDPEAGAQHRLLAEPIGGAEPRRDVLVVRVGELEALGRKARRDDRLEVLASIEASPRRSAPACSARSAGRGSA